jgi:hypothetical protein
VTWFYKADSKDKCKSRLVTPLQRLSGTLGSDGQEYDGACFGGVAGN